MLLLELSVKITNFRCCHLLFVPNLLTQANTCPQRTPRLCSVQLKTNFYLIIDRLVVVFADGDTANKNCSHLFLWWLNVIRTRFLHVFADRLLSIQLRLPSNQVLLMTLECVWTPDFGGYLLGPTTFRYQAGPIINGRTACQYLE